MLLSDGGGQLTQSDKLICDIDNLQGNWMSELPPLKPNKIIK